MKHKLNHLRAKLRLHKKLLIVLCLVGLAVALVPSWIVNAATLNRRYDARTRVIMPENEIAIVLGAGVYSNGDPTPYLKNRVDTAVLLYQTGRVHKILMSGDNSSKKYNEPVAMKKYAVEQGVKSEDVVLDYAGFNTYDTCYRAKHIFGLNAATVISQGYHVPRTVMTCRSLGIDTVGINAVHTSRDFTVSYILRELISTNKALIQLVLRPQPTILGSPEVIQYSHK